MGVARSYLCSIIDVLLILHSTYRYTMSSLWTWTDINYIHAVTNIVDSECWRWNVCWLQDIMLTIIVQLLISEKYVVRNMLCLWPWRHTVPDIIKFTYYHSTSIQYSAHCKWSILYMYFECNTQYYTLVLCYHIQGIHITWLQYKVVL